MSGLQRAYLTAAALTLLIYLAPVVGLVVFALGMTALLLAARRPRGLS